MQSDGDRGSSSGVPSNDSPNLFVIRRVGYRYEIYRAGEPPIGYSDLQQDAHRIRDALNAAIQHAEQQRWEDKDRPGI